MTATIKFKEKKGMLILIIFAALSIYSWLMNSGLFSDSGIEILEDLQAFFPTDLTPPSNYSDWLFQSKTRSGRMIYLFLKHQQYLMILF
jgi:hypothetical protein